VHRHFRGLLSVHSRYGPHTRAATNSWHAYPKASDISSPPCLLIWTPPVWQASSRSSDSADMTAVLYPAYCCSPGKPAAGLDGHSRGRCSSPVGTSHEACPSRHSALPNPRSDRFAITSSTRLAHSLRHPLLLPWLIYAAAACAVPHSGLALCQSRW